MHLQTVLLQQYAQVTFMYNPSHEQKWLKKQYPKKVTTALVHLIAIYAGLQMVEYWLRSIMKCDNRAVHKPGWCRLVPGLLPLQFHSNSWFPSCFQTPGCLQLLKGIWAVARGILSIGVTFWKSGALWGKQGVPGFPYFLLVLWTTVLGSGMQKLPYCDHFVCRP